MISFWEPYINPDPLQALQYSCVEYQLICKNSVSMAFTYSLKSESCIFLEILPRSLISILSPNSYIHLFLQQVFIEC